MSYRPCTCNGYMAESDPKRVNFYNAHFIPRGWELRYYDSLSAEKLSVSLYLTGSCKNCNGDMEEPVALSGSQTGDALLEEIYESMQRVHPYDESLQMKDLSLNYFGTCDSRSAWYRRRDKLPLIERNKKFLNLFNDYDRPQVRRWLEEHHPTQAHEEVLRDTGGELFCKVIQLARENGDMERVKPILDYILPSEKEDSNEHVELTKYEFDFVPIINFGGSEGIYVDCYLKGAFDESKRCSLQIGTLKTLGTSLEDCKAMAELCGALMYHADRYVNENIHRYTPEAELEKEAQRLSAAAEGKRPDGEQ